jgi:glycosyltransferase involved in cell wall biosynthesis
MRFAAVHHGDMDFEDLWAGTPLNIIRGLRQMGHQVEIVDKLLPDPYPLSRRAKIAFYRYLRNKIYLPQRDPAIMRDVGRRVSERLHGLGRFDAVLCTFPPDAAYIETFAPVFVIHDATWSQLQTFYPGYERNCRETVEDGILLDKLAYSRCSHAFLSSRWAIDSVIHDCGVPADKITLARFGPNVKQPPLHDMIPAFVARRGKGAMRLLFLGAPWERKGGDIAIAVAREIEARGVPVELHVVGCTPPAGMPPFVKEHGRLYKGNPEEAALLTELFESSDFMILPTRADATPIVFCEAAAFGLPVMTTDVGGVADTVWSPWAIALPPSASPGEFADWAVPIYQDRARYVEVTTASRTAYEQTLNWTAYGQTLLDRLARLEPNWREETS